MASNDPSVPVESHMKSMVVDRLISEFGSPSREVAKVKSWNLSDSIGAVVQMDQPTRENAAYVWLPYPNEGMSIPEIALEYPGEAGRHSGTYPASGLERGQPALRLTISSPAELDDAIAYARAMTAHTVLSGVKSRAESQTLAPRSSDTETLSTGEFINPASMPRVEPVKPRREAIPRLVQREVWQRDGGRCVECHTRERLCFDHIVPFSIGGGNSVRNLQLLCESCNLSKSNRI